MRVSNTFAGSSARKSDAKTKRAASAARASRFTMRISRGGLLLLSFGFRLQLGHGLERLVWILQDIILASCAADKYRLAIDHHFNRRAHRTEAILWLVRAVLLLFRQSSVLRGQLRKRRLNLGIPAGSCRCRNGLRRLGVVAPGREQGGGDEEREDSRHWVLHPGRRFQSTGLVRPPFVSSTRAESPGQSLPWAEEADARSSRAGPTGSSLPDFSAQ